MSEADKHREMRQREEKILAFQAGLKRQTACCPNGCNGLCREQVPGLEQRDFTIIEPTANDVTFNIHQVLDERGNRYGKFTDHASITQALKRTMAAGRSWFGCTDSQREALEMIAHKIGRMVNGDPFYRDTVVDIIGYAQLMLDDMDKESKDARARQNRTEDASPGLGTR